jgi:hypothetical protein
MKKLSRLNLKELNRLRAAGALGILSFMIMTPLLLLTLRNSATLRAIIVIYFILVMAVVVLYIGLSLHYLLFQ